MLKKIAKFGISALLVSIWVMLSGINSYASITEEGFTPKVIEKRNISKTANDSVYLSLNEEGLLKIEGTGEMKDLDWDTENEYHGHDEYFLSYNDYSYSVKKAVVSEGVTNIGRGAFDNCIYLTEISLPSTIKSIGTQAFFFCESLESIYLSDEITSIGEFAFKYDKKLKIDKLPTALEYIGCQAFANCECISEVILSPAITTIDEFAFNKCFGIKKVSIADNSRLKIVSECAFQKCTSLEEVYVGDGVTILETACFGHDEKLSKVRLPETLEEIGERAFYWCPKYSEITIPGKVTKIGDMAFNGADGYTVARHITFPDDVSSMEIGENVFCLYRGGTIKYRQGEAVDLSFLKDKIPYLENNYNIVYNPYKDETGAVYGYSFTDKMISNKKVHMLYKWPEDWKGEVVVSDVQRIAKWAFKDCKYITSVELIGIEWLDEAIFVNCDSLKKAVINSEAVEFYNINAPFDTFENCPLLSTVIVNCKSFDYASSLLYNCGPEAHIYFPGCELKCSFSMQLPKIYKINTDRKLYMHVCCDTSAELDKEFEDHYRAIASLHCDSINLESSVIYVVRDIHKDLIYHEKVEPTCTKAGSIEYWECQKCGKLVSDKNGIGEIELSDTVLKPEHKLEKVQEKAPTCTIDGCKEHYKCKVCSKLFFDSEGTREITDSKDWVIAACHKLEHVLPKEPTKNSSGNIEYYHCLGCGNYYLDEKATKVISDKDVELKPTKEESHEAEIPKLGTKIKLSKEQYTVISNTGEKPAVRLTNSKIKGKLVVPSTITVNKVTYKVTEISDKAFAGNKKITTVVIGNSVEAIGKEAFKDCTKLREIKLGKNVKVIKKSAFSGCTELTKVTLGSKIEEIQSKAFYRCTSLKNITIPGSVKAIGASAFEKCKKLSKITVKTKKLTSKNVGSKAFKDIAKNAKTKVPKNKVKAYKTLLKKKGMSGKLQKVSK